MNSYKDASDQDEQLQSGYCCWNCRYYIRPLEVSMTDGPISAVCIIDRAWDAYKIRGKMMLGDKETRPDDRCDRFELGLPPSTYPDHGKQW